MYAKTENVPFQEFLGKRPGALVSLYCEVFVIWGGVSRLLLKVPRCHFILCVFQSRGGKMPYVLRVPSLIVSYTMKRMLTPAIWSHFMHTF